MAVALFLLFSYTHIMRSYDWPNLSLSLYHLLIATCLYYIRLQTRYGCSERIYSYIGYYGQLEDSTWCNVHTYWVRCNVYLHVAFHFTIFMHALPLPNDLKMSHHTKSNHINSHHDIPNRIILIWYHMISYLIISNHIISYLRLVRHIISHICFSQRLISFSMLARLSLASQL